MLGATGLASLHGDGASLAVDADGPASTANLLAVALAGDAALGVSELGGANELVTAVALATVLSSSEGEALADAVGNALLVGHGAKVGQDITAENTANVVLVAAGVGVATDGGGSSVVLGARRRSSSSSHGGGASSHGDGLGDGVDVGSAALSIIARAADSGLGGRRGLRLDGLGAGVSNLGGGLGGSRLGWGAGSRGLGGRRGGRRGGGGLAGGRGGGRLTGRGSGVVVGAGRARAGAHLGGSAEAEATERVVAGQLGEGAGDLLVNEGLNGAVAAVEAVEETGALVHASVTGVAGVNDVLEEVLVPAGHEVGVAAVASHITGGEDKGLGALVLGPAALVGLGVVVDLEEDVRSVNPAGGAVLLAVAGIGGVGHVLLVVGEAGGRVVARGEVDVETERRVHAVAGDVGEANASALVVGVDHAGLCAVGADGVRGRVVAGSRAGELDLVDGALGRVELVAAGGGRRALHGVAGQHLQARGEGLDLVVGGLEEVVDVGVVDVDVLKVARLGVVEVERRVPVVAVVALDQGGTAVGLDQVLAGGGEAKVAAAEDVVDVGGGHARVDDGVGTGGDQALVGEAQDSKGSAVLGGGNASHGGHGRGGGELHLAWLKRGTEIVDIQVKLCMLLSTSYAMSLGQVVKVAVVIPEHRLRKNERVCICKPRDRMSNVCRGEGMEDTRAKETNAECIERGDKGEEVPSNFRDVGKKRPGEEGEEAKQKGSRRR